MRDEWLMGGIWVGTMWCQPRMTAPVCFGKSVTLLGKAKKEKKTCLMNVKQACG